MPVPVRLSSLKCWELWQLNDMDLLREVASQAPNLLPPEEWRSIEEHMGFLQSEESYRQYCSQMPSCPMTVEYIAWEYQALIQTPRWQFVTTKLLPYFHPRRILDLGTWTGAHAVDLSNRFPEARVYAREIVAGMFPAIHQTITTYATSPGNLTIEMGDHLVPPLPRNLDLVYAGEVLEHVRDVDEFIRAIEAACRPGAWVVLTTPIESVTDSAGPDTQHVHVRHLEPDDLAELFHNKPKFSLQVINPRWIVTWYQVPPAVGRINYRRKLERWGIDV